MITNYPLQRRWPLTAIFASLFLLAAAQSRAGAPVLHPTFHCIGISWDPSTANAAVKVKVEYRISGSGSAFKRAMDLVHNPYPSTNPPAGLYMGVYRGSLVNLTPNTAYEVKLTELGGDNETATVTSTTRSETFNGTSAYTSSGGIKTTPIAITQSGSAGNFQIYDGQGQVLDLNNAYNEGISINANYIVIRNFVIRRTKKAGITIVGQSSNIVIEDCDISFWGEKDIPAHQEDSSDGQWPDGTITQWGVPDQAGISNDNDWIGNSPAPGGTNFVIQRNRIHDPNWDTNNWRQIHPTASDPREDHPNGPQGIFLWGAMGGHVIRYNEIYTTSASNYNYFNDCLAGGSNPTLYGFPGANSDIYGNYLSAANDDAIESEGGNGNVRIWGNFIEKCYQGIANAPVRVGPLYAWNNVFGRGTELKNHQQGGKEPLYGVKFGTSGKDAQGDPFFDQNMTGYQHFFNNTFLQQSNQGWGMLGPSRTIRRTTTRNNILHTRSSALQAIGSQSSKLNQEPASLNDFDYDLIRNPRLAADNGGTEPVPTNYGSNGVFDAVPIYVSGANTFGYTGTVGSGNSPLTGIYQLAATSPGKSVGASIPNFLDMYGANPDMGAHQASLPPMQFGKHATFIPPAVKWSGMLEAENATFSAPTGTPPTGPAVLARSNASGGEVVDYSHSTGDYIEWNVISPSGNSTPASLKFRYSSTRTGNATLKLYVNGAFVADLPFTPTGNTNTFQVQSATVNLVAGNNTIRLTAGGVPAPLVDKLDYEVLPSGTLQAEVQTLTACVVETTNNTNWTGTGYVNFTNASGSSIEWNINKANASNVAFVFRYANGSGAARTVDLTVNGVTQTVTFGTTTNFSTWANSSAITKAFVAGNNTVKLTTTGQDGPNVDYLSFTSSASANPQARMGGGEAPMETVTAMEKKVSVLPTVLTVTASPNPASGTVRLSVASPVAGAVRLQFVSASGAVTKALSRNLAVGINVIEVPLTELRAGLYLVQVNQDSSRATVKLTVQ